MLLSIISTIVCCFRFQGKFDEVAQSCWGIVGFSPRSTLAVSTDVRAKLEIWNMLSSTSMDSIHGARVFIVVGKRMVRSTRLGCFIVEPLLRFVAGGSRG